MDGYAFWSFSVSGLDLHNPKGLKATRNFQEAKEGSRALALGLESDTTYS